MRCSRPPQGVNCIPKHNYKYIINTVVTRLSGPRVERYGIHQLAVQGEQLSSGPASKEFITGFRSFVKEKGFKTDQLFNCDETGLNYRLLPSVTMARFEKHASGRKKAKDRVTLNLCSNASSTIKLPVHLVSKSKRHRCFRKIDKSMLPIKYSNQSNASQPI